MRVILATSLAALVATSAFAADAVFQQDAPPAAPVEYVPDSVSTPSSFDWKGPYVGADLGYGWGKSTRQGGALLGNQKDEQKMKGAFGGLFAGYNHQINDWVLGAEADVQYSDLKKRMHANRADSKTTYSYGPTWFGTGRARVGYAFDRFLPYATAGLSVARMDYSKKAVAGDSSSWDVEKGKARFGYVVGAGVDYALTDKLVGKLEYQYLDLGKKKVSQVFDNGTKDEADLKFNAHTVRVGLAMKF